VDNSCKSNLFYVDSACDVVHDFLLSILSNPSPYVLGTDCSKLGKVSYQSSFVETLKATW
jgi:hypothetical protein